MERASLFSQVLPLCGHPSGWFVAALCLFVTVGFDATAAAQDNCKVAVVDVSKVFSGYYKTKEIENVIGDSRRASKRDFDARLEDHHRLVEDIALLDKSLEQPSLDAAAITVQRKKREEKVTEIHSQEQETMERKAGWDRDLQELVTRLRNQIVEDIMVVVRARVESGHYDLVLNKSALGGGDKHLILYANPELEITEDIVATLNRNGPGARPAATPRA